MIYEVAGDVAQCLKEHHEVNNYVDDISEPFIDWSLKVG